MDMDYGKLPRKNEKLSTNEWSSSKFTKLFEEITRGILGEFGIEIDTSIVIYYDNQITIQISTEPIQRKWTKHVEIHMHYIRGLVHDEIIALHYYASFEHVVDIFTK